jgi:hypothetical protein
VSEAARLEEVLADFLGAFDIESKVMFEDDFDFARCSSDA